MMKTTVTPKTLFSATQINRAVRRLAETIDAAYAQTEASLPFTLLVVMRGAFHFGSDLSRALQTPHQLAFLSVQSYDGQQRCQDAAPKVQWWLEPEQLAGRQILLVEDIVDTGHTLALLTRVLTEARLDLWASVSLLNKPDAREIATHPTWSAFTVTPDQFVVGYGLDYHQDYRDLPAISIL